MKQLTVRMEAVHPLKVGDAVMVYPMDRRRKPQRMRVTHTWPKNKLRLKS